MKLKSLTLAMLSALMVFAACNSEEAKTETNTAPAPDLAAVRAEIEELERQFETGLNSRNADYIITYYADDAQSMGPNEPTLVGKKAIYDRMQEWFAMDSDPYQTSFETLDVWASGDLAVETGRWIDKDDAGKVLRTGKYMTLFEKRDGRYVAIRDIWNADSAPVRE